MKESAVRMTFRCEDTCINTSKGESWRGGKEYNFTAAEVMHLKEIGHLKRFVPLSNGAIDFINELKENEPVEAVTPITDMSFTEIRAIATEKGIKLPNDVTRTEAITLLTGEDEPLKDKGIEDMTIAALTELAKQKGINIPKDTKKSDIIALLTDWE